MKYVLLCLLLAIGQIVESQDLRSDVETMNEYLETLNNYRLSVHYSVGEGKEDAEEGDVSVVVSSSGLFYSMEDISIVINEEKTLMIDDDEQSIIHADNGAVKKRKSILLRDAVLMGLDSLVSNADSISYAAQDSEKHYYLRFENDYFNLIEITFTNQLITSVSYYYNEDIVGEEGLITNCDLVLEENIDFDEKYLATSFYIMEQEGRVVPTQEFNNYLIVYNESLESFND